MTSRRPLAPGILARLVIALAMTVPAVARSADPVPPITIKRAAGPIVLDGDLSDAGWQGIDPITTWFETNPGDNVEPKVKNAAYLTYDDEYFYAGFRLEDPQPHAIRAPIGDHDAVPSATDYAGVIIDSRNDGKTAQMFLANPNGVQYDAVTSDATGEDSSPDYYWDSVGKVTPTGWTLEIRIPFSSLRYEGQDDPTWGILLYRNYPRDRRYQFFSARLPRDVNCFICNSSKLVGLASLPHGAHLVVAPFATASQLSTPRDDLGSPLESKNKSEAGADVKWNPSTSVAIDGTLNPDFSQVESDAAQIVANERFALSFPEKRPFFLEGSDLLATPLQAVYTRTITSPRAGLRATGKVGSTAYTALVTQDRGHGEAILPGPQGSGNALQDFNSNVGIVRLRHDLGRSFVSLLATGRQVKPRGGNVVFGPDFQWRPRAADAVTGQALWSQSHTPNRPDLTSEWDGRDLSDHAALLSWSHNTRHVDWFAQGLDIGPEFRADDGFIPQVGYREGYFESGYTIRPEKAFLSRVRLWTIEYYDAQTSGGSLNQRVSAGAGMDGRWNSFCRVELNLDHMRVGSLWLERFRPRIQLQAVPGRIVNQLSVDTYFGDEIDFDNAREGSGLTSVASGTLRPSDHLELRSDASLRWVDIDAAGRSRRLFTTQIERLRATWSFNARSFVRLIGQYVQTTSDTALYTFSVSAKEADFSSSALFAYKLNWQTVLYAGYGDNRTFAELSDRLEKSSRQAFAKVSYALQR